MEAQRKRKQLLRRLPGLELLLRGSLLQRTIRHRRGCPKCARGPGHPVAVLTVSYPGGRTRQFSLRAEQTSRVRQWLQNYRKVKKILEAVCELNHHLLRPEPVRKNRQRSKQPGGPRT